jgi:PKD repeat protein
MPIIKVQYKNNGVYTDINFPVVDIIPITLKFYIEGLTFSPSGYLWDFGDGNFNQDATPEHTFTTYGYHYIVVKIKHFNTWETINEDSNIVILGKLDFTVDKTKGDIPLEVQFENRSISPTGYQFNNFLWDFGDSFKATGIAGPFHIYQKYGNYDVKLSADIEPL